MGLVARVGSCGTQMEQVSATISENYQPVIDGVYLPVIKNLIREVTLRE